MLAPFARMKRVQMGRPSSCNSSTSRTAASTRMPGRTPNLDLCRQQLTDQRDRPRLRHRQDEHLAGLDALDDGMHHQVVVLAAEDGAGWAGSAAPWQELNQRQVDETLPAGSLVDGCHAKLSQARQFICCHRLLTTQGSVRCKASACLTSAIPEIRRAWLPRRAASSV